MTACGLAHTETEVENSTMNYPLILFPRFGHQERWTNAQRERAFANSIATRQAMAARNLMVEREFYDLLEGYVQSKRPSNRFPFPRSMKLSEHTARLRAGFAGRS